MLLKSCLPRSVAELDPAWSHQIDDNVAQDAYGTLAEIESIASKRDLSALASILPVCELIEVDYRQVNSLEDSTLVRHSVQLRSGMQTRPTIKNIFATMLKEALTDDENPDDRVMIAPFWGAGYKHIDDSEDESTLYTVSTLDPTVFWNQRFYMPSKVANADGPVATVLLRPFFVRPQARYGARYTPADNVLVAGEAKTTVHAQDKQTKYLDEYRVFLRSHV